MDGPIQTVQVIWMNPDPLNQCSINHNSNIVAVLMAEMARKVIFLEGLGSSPSRKRTLARTNLVSAHLIEQQCSLKMLKLKNTRSYWFPTSFQSVGVRSRHITDRSRVRFSAEFKSLFNLANSFLLKGLFQLPSVYYLFL